MSQRYPHSYYYVKDYAECAICGSYRPKTEMESCGLGDGILCCKDKGWCATEHAERSKRRNGS